MPAVTEPGFALAIDGAGTLRRGEAVAAMMGADGALALPFNCAGLYRGYVQDDGIVYTAIYDEPFEASCH